MRTTTLRFHEHGAPGDVLRREEIAVAPPGPGQVLLRMLAAPINPSDLGSVAGSYGDLPALPAVAGREGVGEVLACGPDKAFAEGRRVLLPEPQGTWRERATADAAGLTPVPDSVPVEQAAMAAINPPTAWLLLKNFVQLQPGDWVIQNAANSAVGHCVIQLCRHRGLRTINLVRRLEWIERLQATGADAVLTSHADLARKVREITDGRLPRLGLNSVGGESAVALIKSLREGGTLVTFGGMTGEPIRFPTRPLIFNDVRLAGFWLHRWRQRNSFEKWRDLAENLFDLIARGVLHAPVEKTFPLNRFHDAVERAASPGREGKILFVPDK